MFHAKVIQACTGPWPVHTCGLKIVDHLPYSAKFWRGNILADLADSPATTKNLPSKVSTLNNRANPVTTQPPKYHHPNLFSGFICQKLTPPKYCAIR